MSEHYGTCSLCKGQGEAKDGTPCGRCGGTGESGEVQDFLQARAEKEQEEWP